MKKTKLKIENFVDNKLENLSIIKGGDSGPGPAESTGGGSTSSGNGGGLGSTSPIPPIKPKTPIT